MHNIVWLTENYFPRTGGMAQSCDRIVYHLRQAGITIHVIHLTNTTNTKQEIVQNGTNLHFGLAQNAETPIDESHSLNLLWNKIEELQRNLHQNNLQKVTHIVCFGGYLAMTAAPIFAAWLSVPLIVLLRGNDFDTAIFSPKKREVLNFALNKANCIACVTKEKTEKVAKLYPNTKVVFTPNGIDSNEWKPLLSDVQKATNLRLKIIKQIQENHIENPHQEIRIIGIFGQLKAKKGVLFFMEALQKTSFANQTHLLIVGEMENETQTFLDNLSNNIQANKQDSLTNNTQKFSYTHIPFMARFDLLPYYLACDAIAIPSFYDGMPNVLLEAAAVGVPFIASNAGGMTDVLDENHAFIFQSNNLQDCTTTIENFWYCKSEILKQKGKLLQNHIKSNFSYHQERDNYLKIIKL